VFNFSADIYNLLLEEGVEARDHFMREFVQKYG
jgi:hypothetical protein